MTMGYGNTTWSAATASYRHLGQFIRVLLMTAFAATASTNSYADANEEINALLDGLHHDAATANFDSYFARYTDTAIFLGTDKTERWDIAAFKAYAKPVFDAGKGWTYLPESRSIMGEGEIRWFDEILSNEKYGYCRGTGVVSKTETGWKIEHYSLTFLIPNEVAAEATALGKTPH